MISNLVAPIVIGAAIIFILAIAILFIKGRASSGARLQAHAQFMSAPEQQLYSHLVQALPSQLVFAQVALGQILFATGGDKNENFSKFGQARQKVVDFLICSKDFKMLSVIELDDSSHSREKDSRRDAMLTEAGLKIIRWHVKKMPTTSEIQSALI